MSGLEWLEALSYLVTIVGLPFWSACSSAYVLAR